MDKKEDTSSAMWLKFFKEAGIPTKTGASYALIFADNRINKNMLSELTVDYLRLMGITLMGDIIAILRHCKSVHQDSMRKVVILKSKEEKPQKDSSESASSSSESSSETSDEEIVPIKKPVAKKISSAAAPVKVPPAKVVQENDSKLNTHQVKSKVTGKIISSTVAEKKPPPQSVKRNYTDDDEKSSVERTAVIKTTSSVNSGRSILKSNSEPEVKKIRILPDSEMFGPKLPPPKKTVFDRLGADQSSPQVSSTTEGTKIEPPKAVETKFTRIISNVNLPGKKMRIMEETDTPLLKSNSVFARLGGLRDEEPQVERTLSSLQYVGVLKSPPATKKLSTQQTRPIIKIGTMRADEPEIPVKLRAAPKAVPSGRFSMRDRLQSDSLQYQTSAPKQEPRFSMKDRLRSDSLQYQTSAPKQEPRFSMKDRLRSDSLQYQTSAQMQKPVGSIRLKRNIQSEGIFANDHTTENLNVRNRLGLSTGSVGRAFGLNSSNKRLRRSTSPADVNRRSNNNEDRFLSRTKRVSFGRVEQKTFSPIRQRINTNFMKNDLIIRGRSNFISKSRIKYGRFKTSSLAVRLLPKMIFEINNNIQSSLNH